MMKRYRLLHSVLFILYLSFLIYVVLFASLFGRVVATRDYNLIPFDTIKRYFIYRSQFGELNFITNIYGNIIAFMPMGYFVYVLEKRHHLLRGFLIPFCASMVIEMSQFWLSVGSLDVDDLILNTVGGFGAYAFLFVVVGSVSWWRNRGRKV